MLMQDPTLTDDPSGLDGERHIRDDSNAPYIIEVWSYAAHVAMEAIRTAWLAVLPLGSCAGFKEELIRGGRRFVKIDRLERMTSDVRPSVDSPNV